MVAATNPEQALEARRVIMQKEIAIINENIFRNTKTNLCITITNATHTWKMHGSACYPPFACVSK